MSIVSAKENDLRTQIEARTTDPEKLRILKALPPAVLMAIITQHVEPQSKEDELLKEYDAWGLRVIYQHTLFDWNSKRSNKIEKEIKKFTGDETFTSNPDFINNQQLIDFAERQHIKRPYSLEQMEPYGFQMIGAKISGDRVEVLILTHQSASFLQEERISRVSYSREKYKIPKQILVGILKINPDISLHGRPGDIYISVWHPTEYKLIDVVIGNIYDQQQKTVLTQNAIQVNSEL